MASHGVLHKERKEGYNIIDKIKRKIENGYMLKRGLNAKIKGILHRNEKENKIK